MCRNPTAVVEVASELGLPVSVVKILLSDLLHAGWVSARHPSSQGSAQLPDVAFLKKVLIGLQGL
jgi:predicted transcriptional regulator